ENETKFLRRLLDTENLAHYNAWIKSTSVRFYEIDFWWKKRNRPKHGKFSPDIFIKIENLIQVVEIKGDEELREPSEENYKKYEYAQAHFLRLNEYLEMQESMIRYRFNFLSPTSF